MRLKKKKQKKKQTADFVALCSTDYLSQVCGKRGGLNYAITQYIHVPINDTPF